MRKILMLATIAMMLMLAPVASRAGSADQHATGTILLPTRYAEGDPTTDGWPFPERNLNVATMGLENGTLGYVIDIPQDSWCNDFVVKPISDQTGAADLDIDFYMGWDDIYGSDTISTVNFEHRTTDGIESGVVPPDAIKALVFTYNGVNTKFTFDSISNGNDSCYE